MFSVGDEELLLNCYITLPWDGPVCITIRIGENFRFCTSGVHINDVTKNKLKLICASFMKI